ncbi:MAG: YbaB/EbfC family nucleoid-associated protein [Anaerolineales bacterium]|nr:MAG: YbaB/EbfC family nucleoid-associated protein [Anaerolineales bacterium]
MAKGKGKGMRMPKGTKGGLGMAQQLQKLQQEMLDTQEALGDEVFEVTAGGGAIKVAITGHQRIQSIVIDPEVVDPEDVDMLQDLIVAAVNEAIEKSQTLAAERLGGLTGGLGLPGLF